MAISGAGSVWKIKNYSGRAGKRSKLDVENYPQLNSLLENWHALSADIRILVAKKS